MNRGENSKFFTGGWHLKNDAGKESFWGLHYSALIDAIDNAAK